MPTIIGHALVGASVANYLRPLLTPARRRVAVAAAVLAMLPDTDAVGYFAGVPYDSPFGHRGVTHSLVFAALTSGVVCAAIVASDDAEAGAGSRRWPLLLGMLFAAAASHPLLDMLTNGGYGCALYAPFSWARLFFAVTPIPVSPIGIGARTLVVLAWELAFFLPLFLGSLAAHWRAPKVWRWAGGAFGVVAALAAFLFRLSF